MLFLVQVESTETAALDLEASSSSVSATVAKLASVGGKSLESLELAAKLPRRLLHETSPPPLRLSVTPKDLFSHFCLWDVGEHSVVVQRLSAITRGVGVRACHIIAAKRAAIVVD